MKYIMTQDKYSIVNLNNIVVTGIQKNYSGGYNIIGYADLNGTESILLGHYNTKEQTYLVFNKLAIFISEDSDNLYFMPKKELNI